MNFFTKDPKLKKKHLGGRRGGGGERGGRAGASVSEFF